jgi:hypothetical protein
MAKPFGAWILSWLRYSTVSTIDRHEVLWFIVAWSVTAYIGPQPNNLLKEKVNWISQSQDDLIAIELRKMYLVVL